MIHHLRPIEGFRLDLVDGRQIHGLLGGEADRDCEESTEPDEGDLS
jgi:hypothetical protein